MVVTPASPPRITMRSEIPIQHFNLETMSGVTPGTRTQTYQRLRLRSLRKETPAMTWAQLQWYDQPAYCTLHLQTAPDVWAVAPLLTLFAPFDQLTQRLGEALQHAGWVMEGCGGCAFWQPVSATTPDGLHSGLCRWSANGVMIPSTLGVQSSLALSCPHWQAHPAGAAEQTALGHAPSLDPLRKVAEVSESKLSLAGRMRRKLARWARITRPATDWAAQLLERSGVGAGTEPCFVCHGRIANLGALAVETTDGDTQTFSVWRCRNCYTLYLNDWVDRWVRLDSLETEERYYRVAPAEAVTLLKEIAAVQDAEHPGRRAERTLERERMHQFVASRIPLSHQIRQGR
jgi:hypothetical protein